MRNRFLLIIIIAFSLLVVSCSKKDGNKVLTESGTLIDGGSPVFDGMGFYIEFPDGLKVSPVNLPESYLQPAATSPVKVSFFYTGQSVPNTRCLNCVPIPAVFLVSIKRL